MSDENTKGNTGSVGRDSTIQESKIQPLAGMSALLVPVTSPAHTFSPYYSLHPRRHQFSSAQSTSLTICNLPLQHSTPR